MRALQDLMVVTAIAVAILLRDGEAFIYRQQQSTNLTPLRFHRTFVVSRVGDFSTAAETGKSVDTTHNRRISRRWNGNYKHASKRLCDVSKAKKLMVELSVKQEDGAVVTKTLEKKRQETVQHVLTKAVLWKLYCDEYPNIEIELDIDDPDYLPDVISLPDKNPNDDPPLMPLFWGESGRMKVHKAIDLMKRYPKTHIVHCRWSMDIDTFAAPLLEHLQELYDGDALGDLPDRPGRFTFCALPLDVWRFIDEESGMMQIARKDLEWRELEFPMSPSIVE